MSIRNNFQDATNHLFEAFDAVAVNIEYTNLRTVEYNPETGQVEKTETTKAIKGFWIKSLKPEEANENPGAVIKVKTNDLPDDITLLQTVKINNRVFSLVSTEENDFITELTVIATEGV